MSFRHAAAAARLAKAAYGKGKTVRVLGKFVPLQSKLPVTSRKIREVRDSRSTLYAVC